MDEINKRIESFLNSQVEKCIETLRVKGLSESQIPAVQEQIRNYLSQVVVGTLIDRLSSEQLKEVENLDPDSQELEEKLQLFASGMPDLALEIEEKIKQAVINIQKNSNIS